MVVTPDELPDRDDLGVEPTIADEVIQHRRTSPMIFPVDDLVARISAVCPLPGDLIVTGTPDGGGTGAPRPGSFSPRRRSSAVSREWARSARPSSPEAL